MAVKITYFVHGTTMDNENGLSTGQAQGELSTLGIKQSQELPNQIKAKDFHIVFCSDLKRAVDSATISFGGKFKIIQDKRLRECNYGQLNQAHEEKVKYENHIEALFPKGESLKDVEKRVKNFLLFLRKNYDGKHVAIVAHKSTQIALEVLINGKTWKHGIAEDWRIKKAWQPGWKYLLE